MNKLALPAFYSNNLRFDFLIVITDSTKKLNHTGT